MIVALAAPTPGAADEFSARIKTGTIQGIKSGPVFGTYSISGNQRFTFSATFDGAGTEALCEPCQAGETISMSSVISIGEGTATYRGQTWLFDFDTGGGFFHLQGPSFTLPPGESTQPTTVEFETPFIVQNDTLLFLQGGENGEIQHFLRLTGSGTATARFQVTFDEFLQTHLYTLESIRFEFSKRGQDSRLR
jgi:hypothetical protein